MCARRRDRVRWKKALDFPLLCVSAYGPAEPNSADLRLGDADSVQSTLRDWRRGPLARKDLCVEAGREVVVSLGAVQTPKLLMQSGIGDEAELRRVGVPILQALPGVGRNLHDHVAFGCVWESTDDTLPRVPRSQTACFWKTAGRLHAPNFYAYARRGPEVTAENAVRFNPPAASWSLIIGMRPKSRGAIHLTGPNPTDPTSTILRA